MLENLSQRLQETFKKLRGKGKLTETDVEQALREVRLALLEADVNFKVVKEFIAKVKERAVGQEVLQSLTPAQQVIKIVHEELTALMGGSEARLTTSGDGPTVILMVGLQGSGKTTSTGKLARHLRKQGRQPLLVAADVYRPAAIDQLETLGSQLDLPVFSRGTDVSPVQIAREALAEARRTGRDTVLIDTAGRLHVDEKLMEELQAIQAVVKPHEILLVVDAMTGQDAVNVAETFNERLGLTGVILTKLDGDTRGGAALSVRQVTGSPIKFAGVGEKLDGLEVFHPERMASRILGMGDMLTLIEKAQQNFDQQKAQELQQKLRKQEFSLDDFLDQMQQVRQMGPLDEILGMLPGMGNVKALKGLTVDEKELGHVEAIIRSMTPEERRNPSIMDASRRKRVARGSGTRVQDVNRLLKQFDQMRRLMKGMVGGKGPKGLKGFKLPF